MHAITLHNTFGKFLVYFLFKNKNNQDILYSAKFYAGSAEDRGISAWQVSEQDEATIVDQNVYDAGYEVYDPPLLSEAVMASTFMKYVPFLPYKGGRVSYKTERV